MNRTPDPTQGQPASRRKRLFDRPYLLLVLTMLFWGGNVVAGRLAVGEISAISITSLRWLMTGSIMLGLYHRTLREHWPALRPHLGLLIALGVMGFTVYNALYYWAAHITTAVNISIICGALPALILIGGQLFLGTRAYLLQWVGALISIVGVAVVTTRGDLSVLLELRLNLGDLLILTSTTLYAAYSLLLRRRPKVPSLALFAALTPVAALSSMVLLAGEVAGGQFQPPTLTGWMILAYIALFPSLLGQVFYIRAVDLIGASRAGMFGNLVPVFGATLAVLLLDEAFTWYHAAALALVLAGICVAEYRGRRGATA